LPTGAAPHTRLKDPPHGTVVHDEHGGP
jgi:hypothetical protein